MSKRTVELWDDVEEAVERIAKAQGNHVDKQINLIIADALSVPLKDGAPKYPMIVDRARRAGL